MLRDVSQIQQLHIATMFDHCGYQGFYDKLADQFAEVVVHDAFYVLLENDDQLKLVYGQMQDSQYGQLEQEIILPSLARQTVSGMSVLSQLGHQDLVTQPIHRSQWLNYCQRHQIKDQIMLWMQITREQRIWIVVDLKRSYPFFTSEQINRVKHWLPTLEKLLYKHHRDLALNKPLPDLIHAAIDSFSHKHLTRRESELVKLMFLGYSSKLAAKALSISPATERVHRINIYAKLGISGQSELLQRLIREVESELEQPASC
ncbi:helix-turn-helix domain-containing protein [Vibrio europaeus]|uniref:helix-turn-helix domain-containing protein n=1 Tax=Vibrio europaeus TaxID=300876 RepID=UPI00233E57EA|nr:helix-turn-helix transcriptional regulator [Vibrio europaeus]MDC5821327.1 helix-turn-helix transcriptional regulator [Vibrio europaeus]MDC5852791.1 helix-turn-helix transcriptional regulator [Vibrio europaeus]MDC5868324.1 helix-turn-helix transcriptional regulator [Vibrio europaeus]